jgi:transposase
MFETKFDNRREEIGQFEQMLSKGDKIVMEACGTWQYMYDYFDDKGFETQLAHPTKTSTLVGFFCKTDKIDSYNLAELCRLGKVPLSYVPDKYVRDLRTLSRHRASLVSIRTQVKNKIHAILAMKGINFGLSDIYGKKGMLLLENLSFNDHNDLALKQLLNVLENLNKEIKEVETEIDKVNKDDEDVKLLLSIDGIGSYLGILIKSEIGEISRFKRVQNFVSYCGLNPRVYQSGFKTRYGKISKQGSKWLRWAFVQATHAAIRCDGRIKDYYESKKYKGKKVAVISTARYMARVVHSVLKNKQAYKSR